MEDKLYYTMGEVARMLGESPSLVRFWATTFEDIIRPSRNNKGNRLFTQADVRHFKLIHHLVKERGMTLEGAARQMRTNREGTEKTVEVLASLRRIKEELLEIKEFL